MTTNNIAYAGSANLTITLADLADGALRQAAAIDNGASNNYLDALVGGKLKTGTIPSGVAAANGYVDIYVAASADDGTTYSGNASGSNAAYTKTAANLFLLKKIWTPAAATSYEFGPFSIAALFGGRMPDLWTIIVGNRSGGPFDSTAGSFEIHYMGITETNA